MGAAIKLLVPNLIGPFVDCSLADMPNLIPLDVDLFTDSGKTNFVNVEELIFVRSFEGSFRLLLFSDGFGVQQQAHVVLSLSLLTIQVEQVHLEPAFTLNKELKLSVGFSSGFFVSVEIGVCRDKGVDVFVGFGVAQHAHLSADSGFEARHMLQFHLGSEFAGLILKKLIGSLFSLDFVVSVDRKSVV